jgi:sulfonate transport system substrate-binding protein
MVKKSFRIHVLAVACLMLAALTLTSCKTAKESPTTQQTTTVRFGTMGDAVDYGPYMVARAKGWFEEAFRPYGITKVDYTTFQSLPALNESLATSRIDVVFEAEPPAIIGKTVAGDLRIIGISCSLNQEILVRSAARISQVAQLKGKKVSVPAGTSSHYNVLAILSAAGVSDADVQIIDMSPPDAKNAFETGQVDGWAIWPPWVEEEVISGKGKVLAGTKARIHSIMSVRGSFQDQNRELVRAAFDVLERSKAWLREHPDEAREIIASTLKLDKKVIDLAWPKHDWTVELNKEITDDIQAKADFLYKRGLIKTSINVSTQLIFPLPPSK